VQWLDHLEPPAWPYLRGAYCRRDSWNAKTDGPTVVFKWRRLDACGIPFVENEVVVVRELARGGLSFYSATKYPEGSRVEIAVPYSSKAPQYLLARKDRKFRGMERAKGLPEYEYGVAYLE